MFKLNVRGDDGGMKEVLKPWILLRQIELVDHDCRTELI